MTVRSLLLLSCSVLWLAGPVHAQTSYSTGSTPQSQPSSATYQRGDAPLPELSPDRIAADVVTEFNPRTGARERVAPTFDPFEMDDRLAGSVNLRSTDVAYDLDNRLFQDGVLLEVNLYYNDDGQRDFGRMRDALFLNGEPVPIIRRDSRELECSSRVTETIYSHDRFYTPGYGGIFRSRPRYRGHFGYDRFWGGFGYHSRRFDRPFRSYGRSGYRHRSNPYRRGTRRDHYRDHSNGYYNDRRERDRFRDTRPRRGGRDATPPRTRPRDDRRFNPDDSGLAGGVERERTRDRVRSERRTPRVDRPRRTSDRSNIERRPRRDISPTPDGTRERPVRRRDTERRSRNPDLRERPRSSTGRSTSPRVTPRPERRAEPRPQRRTERRAEPRTEPRPQRRPEPRLQPRTQDRPGPSAVAPKRPRPHVVPTERLERSRVPHKQKGRKRLELFPGDGYSESVVVSTQWDCAREDQLILFIPNDRLDAARFDGLTLMLRDTTYNPSLNQTTVYDERPLYVPPNYIQGFQIAKRQG